MRQKIFCRECGGEYIIMHEEDVVPKFCCNCAAEMEEDLESLVFDEDC